jgi:tetratricopeptide (TPR) repeat protein
MKLNIVGSLMISLFCISCSTAKITGELSENEKELQENELNTAQVEFEQDHFAISLAKYREFKKKHVGSPYFFRAQIGESKALEGLGQWQEAILVLRQAVEVTRQHQPELAALSLYELSFCYEAVGDEVKTMASLMDAASFAKYLPPEIQKAEIPARLAASHHRMGHHAEAQQYLQKAEAGLIELRASETISSETIARTYFQMGLLSTRQVSFENFKAVTDTLRAVQIFSLHAIEADDAKWSPLAAETLLGTYKDLKKIITEIPIQKAMDSAVAIREQRASQAQLSGDLLVAVQQLKSLHLVKEEERTEVTNFYSELETIENQLNEIIVKDPVKNELSKESSKWNRLKREGRVKSQPLFKEEVQGVDKK